MISKDPFIKVTDALKESGNYRVSMMCCVKQETFLELYGTASTE